MKIDYIVLYLKDTKKGMDFWVNKMGYEKKSENIVGEEIVFTVGKSGDNTNLELVPLKLMEENPFSLNLGIPSMAFASKNLESEHKKLKEKGVKVSEINNYAGRLSFTFFDYENNAFAVVQKI